MITKEIAMSLPYGAQLQHRVLKGTDKLPLRCRVTGKCKTWSLRPEFFQLPVKHGLNQSFYITPQNAKDWNVA